MNSFKLIIGGITSLFFGVLFTLAYTGNGAVYSPLLSYIPGGDKTGHVVLMCLLSMILTWIASFRTLKIWGAHWICYGTLAVFIFITTEEFLQLLSPHRNFDWVDLSCNYMGLILGVVIIRHFKKPHPSRDLIDH